MPEGTTVDAAARSKKDKAREPVASWVAAGAAVAALLLLAGCLKMNHTFVHDDTFITLRYARHVVEGYGPVWNAHGPRVEGFTSPLHLLLVSLVGAMGVPLLAAARTVNVTAHVALMTFVFVYLRRRVGLTGGVLGAALLAASWSFAIWDLGGLDEVLYACLSTVGALVGTRFLDVTRQGRERGLLCGIGWLTVATLARPEGALLVAGMWVLGLVGPRVAGRGKVQLLLKAAGVAVAIMLPMVLFRWIYFHQLLPNTAYAKIGGISGMELAKMGLRYLLSFLFSAPFLGLMAAGAGAWSLKRDRFKVVDAGLWWMAGLMALFIVVSGGDHMRAYRFCVPLYSLLAVLVVRHVGELGWLRETRTAAAVAAVLLVALGLQKYVVEDNPREPDPAEHVGRLVGEYMHRRWPAGSVVALNTAGSTPFFADEYQYIDMLGLNDFEIARRKNVPTDGPWIRVVGHLKGDGASVLRRRPDFVILGPAHGTTVENHDPIFFIGDYELGTNPVFQAEYRWCTVGLGDGSTLTYYERRDAKRVCPGEAQPGS